MSINIQIYFRKYFFCKYYIYIYIYTPTNSQKYLQIGYLKWQQISVLKAWTEVCHEIFAGWEVQTMWNLQKNV